MNDATTTRISDEDAWGLAEKMVVFAEGLNEGERSLYWAALHGRIAPEAADVSGYIIVDCAPMTAPQLFNALLTPATSAVSSQSL